MIFITRWYVGVFFLLKFLSPAILKAQAEPIASFSFNDGKDEDEISGHKAKLINTSRSADRFGNKDNAVFISGSNYSYVNLGTYKALKPLKGTISLWVNLDGVIYSGLGGQYNPILLTKQTNLDDFYESYGVYYFHIPKKFAFISSVDSLVQVCAYSREGDYLNKWHHLVISYDEHSLSLYVDGNLEGRVDKQFTTRFLGQDSVMVGHTANKKNQRFMCGSVDDINFYDQVLTHQQVQELYHAPDPNKNSVLLKWLLFVSGACILGILIYFYTRYRVKVAVEIEKQKLEQINTALENELRIHRALMNPHFIFNTLNGLHDLVLKKEYDGASDYLVKFSELLRKILESNMSDVITLDLEVELLQRYIEIENLRFEERFSCTISVASDIVPSATIIPIMMLQPFVENAIWHGLLAKEGEKSIFISFSLHEKIYLKCVIEDNGKGLQPNPGNGEKKSLATTFIRQRLALLNKIHSLNCRLTIENRPHSSGTCVTLILPILNG